MIRAKRVYDKPGKEDGFRILVDRIWPRGMSKGEAGVDLWLKEVAPSGGLRKWFSHEPEKWGEFQKRYKKELKERPEQIQRIRQLEKNRGTVTLLYAAKDEEHNNAVALMRALSEL